MDSKAVVRRASRLLTRQEQVTRELESLRSDLAPELPRLPVTLQRILDCIHEELFDPTLNVNRVRSRCALRNNNVSTMFRRMVGIGMREYIEERRLAAACSLLRRNEAEVFLIAAAVGYENHETFCRAFQRRFRCTPSQYRLGQSPN